MEISALGDAALLIDFSDETDDVEVLLTRATTAAAALAYSPIAGVLEVTSSYRTVAVFLDEAVIGEATNKMVRQQIASRLDRPPDVLPGRSRQIEIPVCYDEEFALDLPRVAEHTGLAPERVIELHRGAEYTTACIGFMPGFPYLAGLPPQLATPRLSEPRVRVPAGSVAIANAHAGIYPLESPGGWNILGRTPVRLFDPSGDPPVLITAGDRIRFRQVSRADFDAWNR